ncbi:MAG: DUF72 domain-containing protein [Candidatus Hodarchaeales archaeon]|jgi:uncharacterized protein YecE (DUF72 family)
MPVQILIGTSGFGYIDWVARQDKTRLPFYPNNLKTHQRLSYYSEIFNTVEINTTFYHNPRDSVVNKWETYVPKEFVFSFKIPRLITHKKKLKNYWNDLERFLDIMKSGLRAKIGPALLQLPPKFSDKYFTHLEQFLKYWPPDYKLAVEFRENSWVEQPRLKQTLDLLSHNNVAYCIVDEPLLPPITPITTNFSYIRFHGHGLRPWYNYHYSLDELKKWAANIQKISKESTDLKEIYTYFNNHPAGHAPANARQLAILLGKSLKSPEAIDMVEVRKRAGDAPQHSLTGFIDGPKVELDDYVRFCTNCGEMILREDNYCEICGQPVEIDKE